MILLDSQRKSTKGGKTLPNVEMELDPDLPGTSQNEVSTPISNLNKISSGMERYITITKRKRSPTSLPQNNNPKNKISKPETQSQNRYAALSNEAGIIEPDDKDKPTTLPKPPPIYLREASSKSLIGDIEKCIGDNNFYLADLKRGQVTETKIQTSKEAYYCKVVELLEKQNKNFYTFQLKSAKGLKVVLKGIDHNVDPDEIKADLVEKGFEIKHVSNIRNRYKIPQPMFKVELMPEASKAPRGKPHPIYNIQYILHRRIKVEEPHKSNSPVQCQNCQEFGHTKTYCQLDSYCVACGEQHQTKNCPKDKKDSTTKKCSNCSGHHTANFRGCPVYTHFFKSINQANKARATPLAYSQPKQSQISPPTTYTTQFNQNISYADIAKGQAHLPQQNNNQFSQENLSQILMMLVTNMQQLTATIQEMQKTIIAQNATLINLASK